MAFIETKYGVGDVVWAATTRTEQRQHDCPDCLGSRKWEARSPAGGVFAVDCPRCGDVYQSNRALSLKYTLFVPSAQKLTIGQVRAYSGPDGKTEYMAHETGIGSGSLWYEDRLFPTQEEATAAAQAVADEQNSNPEGWVKKQYDETAKFSDYQLREASIAAADYRRIQAEVRVGMLLDDLDEAASVEEVKDLIATWRESD